jgi:hypothetical protein
MPAPTGPPSPGRRLGPKSVRSLTAGRAEPGRAGAGHPAGRPQPCDPSQSAAFSSAREDGAREGTCSNCHRQQTRPPRRPARPGRFLEARSWSLPSRSWLSPFASGAPRSVGRPAREGQAAPGWESRPVVHRPVVRGRDRGPHGFDPPGGPIIPSPGSIPFPARMRHDSGKSPSEIGPGRDVTELRMPGNPVCVGIRFWRGARLC